MYVYFQKIIFENFIDNRVVEDRFKNATDFIRAGSRLLEVQEH